MPNTPLQKYKACLKNNPKSIICNWEIGWIYYTKAKWKKVQQHWNIAYFISKNETFKKTIKKNLDSVDNLAALELLSYKYKKEIPNRSPASTNNLKPALTLNAVGDVMLGLETNKSPLPHLQTNPFKRVSKFFNKTDLNFLNLEGMFCDQKDLKSKCGEDSKGCYSFRTPTKYIKPIINHFNLTSLANNHSLDYGFACMKETQAILDQNKIHYSNGLSKIAQFEHNNLKISFIAFHTGASFKFNVNEITKAQKIIRKQQNSDIIIVSFHGGAEGHDATRVPYKMEHYYSTKRGDLVNFAHKVIDAGADIVLGHGPHIVRGIELYKNKIIAYSLGNFSTYGEFNLNGLLKYGYVFNINTDNQGNFLSGNIHSTIQRQKGIPYIDSKNTSLNYIRALSKIDFPKSKLQFDLDGSVKIETDYNVASK